MIAYDKIIDAILAAEGGYVDDKDDKGGATNYGITEAVARANGYTGDMRDLPVSLARNIYQERYIAGPGFLRIAAFSEPIASELIDTGVNMGTGVASTMLQRWLNGFNDRGSKYADLLPDGRIGGITISALQAYLQWRGKEGEAVMVVALNCTQGVRYLDIAERDQSQEKYLYGWMRNRVANILGSFK